MAKTATRRPKKQEPKPIVEETRSPRVTAGRCIRNANHKKTRVYTTKGRTRYCVCDDCGATWKVEGPEATAPDVKASDCPNCGRETTRMYRQDGNVGRCVCDGCGHQWTESAEKNLVQ